MIYLHLLHPSITKRGRETRWVGVGDKVNFLFYVNCQETTTYPVYSYVGSGKGGGVRRPYLYLCGVERLFPIDPLLKKIFFFS